jgi:hypothetical protein
MNDLADPIVIEKLLTNDLEHTFTFDLRALFEVLFGGWLA